MTILVLIEISWISFKFPDLLSNWLKYNVLTISLFVFCCAPCIFISYLGLKSGKFNKSCLIARIKQNPSLTKLGWMWHYFYFIQPLGHHSKCTHGPPQPPVRISSEINGNLKKVVKVFEYISQPTGKMTLIESLLLLGDSTIFA